MEIQAKQRLQAMNVPLKNLLSAFGLGQYASQFRPAPFMGKGQSFLAEMKDNDRGDLLRSLINKVKQHADVPSQSRHMKQYAHSVEFTLPDKGSITLCQPKSYDRVEIYYTYE